MMRESIYNGVSSKAFDMPKQINSPVLEAIGRQLSEARARKGLSQRALADRVGLPQGHISKIEQGQVDLRLSSLTELARALDLDVQLVPRHALPAVEGVLRAAEAEPQNTAESRALSTIAHQLGLIRSINEHHPNLDAARKFTEKLGYFEKLPFDSTKLQLLQRAVAPVEQAVSQAATRIDREELVRLLDRVNRALNKVQPEKTVMPQSDASRALPAFRLDEDDDD